MIVATQLSQPNRSMWKICGKYELTGQKWEICHVKRGNGYRQFTGIKTSFCLHACLESKSQNISMIIIGPHQPQWGWARATPN
jgi:hypothetical protein